MTNCPVCQKAVDPLRARSVGVRAGKVVAYCSAECAAAAETGPVSSVTATLSRPVAAPLAAPKSAAPRATLEDFESGPVIEIIHEPASGVVTSARDAREDPSGSPPPAEPLIKLDKKTKAKPPDKPRTSEQATEMSGERTNSARIPIKTPDAEIITSAEPREPTPVSVTAIEETPKRPGTRTQRRRKDSLDSKAAWDWLDDEPAEQGKRKQGDQPRSRAAGVVLVMLVLALVGAGGYLVYRYVTERGAGEQGSAADPGPGATIADGPQVAVDASPEVGSELASAVERSIAVLRQHLLGSTSQRVQREAAAGLARTGDTEAIETLAKLLETERIGQIGIAYFLARSKDARGVDYLIKASKSADRSDKLEAAAHLARLGDVRGADPLASYLKVKQHRFDAAKHLALLQDPRAVAFFQDIRASAKASEDDKARAAIALGLAGDREVATELRALLTRDPGNKEAAAALVALADPAARPALIKDLTSAQNQARAAQQLRKLEPALDAWPLVKPLVAQLGLPDLEGTQNADKTNRDVNQISIAETILLLAGPAHWADRP